MNLVPFFFTSLSADSNEKLILPVDLTKLNWYVKQGFAASDLSKDQITDQTEYKKIANFPIILNSIYKIPISNDSVKEFTLQCNFQLNLERIDKGKELAFLFSGIVEKLEIYLKGEKII